jgi:hypothetical protein
MLVSSTPEVPMTEPNVTAELTPSEWSLIQAMRGLPEGPMKARVAGIFGELLFYVRNPRCQGMGPEGFPCGDPRSTCEECHRMWDLLDEISARSARA